MKLIHTSDLHLDSPLTTRLSSDKIRERKRELIASFKASVERARALGASGYIIAGDLFDSERVSKRVLETVLATVKDAREITFYYLTGNHEGTMLLNSGLTLPDNLKLFGEDWTYFEEGDVVIAGRRETDGDMLKTLKLDSKKRNVVVLHGELADKCATGGKIGIRELESLPIDYLALGHYHTYSSTRIADRCTAVYSGTPEGRGFDEDGDKGVVLVTTDAYGITHEFIKSAYRTLRIISVDVSGLHGSYELEKAIENATRGASRADLLRIVLIGERELDERIDTESLLYTFRHSYYYFEIKDETKVRISADDFKSDKSLKGEFIRGVLLDPSLTDREREKIIETGLAALLGEAID